VTTKILILMMAVLPVVMWNQVGIAVQPDPMAPSVYLFVVILEW
jgi:hypothetical protein